MYSTILETQPVEIHRSDPIQGTDYIANYFLNLSVSGTKIENLKWKIGWDIILINFGKFVTSY